MAEIGNPNTAKERQLTKKAMQDAGNTGDEIAMAMEAMGGPPVPGKLLGNLPGLG